MKNKVLVIEDDSFIAGLITETLNKAGFETTLASDGEGGFRKMNKEAPDVILLDLILPGMNGFEFLEKIKGDKKTMSTPVVIISNLGSEDETKKGLRLGAHSYLIKAHILPDDLIKKIKEILQQKIG